MERNYQDSISRRKKAYGNKFSAESLNPAFIPYYESGERITVDFGYEKKRGTIGMTTGWKPVFLLMARKDSVGSSDTINMNDKIVPYEKQEKKVYMIRKDKKAYITFNKKEAFELAEKHSAEVFKLSYGYYKDCNFAMDAPTFATVGERIF